MSNVFLTVICAMIVTQRMIIVLYHFVFKISLIRLDFFFNKLKNLVDVAEWVARQTVEQEVSSSKPGIPPLLKHACGEGDWLLCWHYTPAKVSHQRWISGNIYHICLCKVQIWKNPLWLWNPDETSPEVQNRGISGPTNGHLPNKNLKKKILYLNSQPTDSQSRVITFTPTESTVNGRHRKAFSNLQSCLTDSRWIHLQAGNG